MSKDNKGRRRSSLLGKKIPSVSSLRGDRGLKKMMSNLSLVLEEVAPRSDSGPDGVSKSSSRSVLALKDGNEFHKFILDTLIPYCSWSEDESRRNFAQLKGDKSELGQNFKEAISKSNKLKEIFGGDSDILTQKNSDGLTPTDLILEEMRLRSTGNSRGRSENIAFYKRAILCIEIIYDKAKDLNEDIKGEMLSQDCLNAMKRALQNESKVKSSSSSQILQRVAQVGGPSQLKENAGVIGELLGEVITLTQKFFGSAPKRTLDDEVAEVFGDEPPTLEMLRARDAEVVNELKEGSVYTGLVGKEGEVIDPNYEFIPAEVTVLDLSKMTFLERLQYEDLQRLRRENEQQDQENKEKEEDPYVNFPFDVVDMPPSWEPSEKELEATYVDLDEYDDVPFEWTRSDPLKKETPVKEDFVAVTKERANRLRSFRGTLSKAFSKKSGADKVIELAGNSDGFGTDLFSNEKTNEKIASLHNSISESKSSQDDLSHVDRVLQRRAERQKRHGTDVNSR